MANTDKTPFFMRRIATLGTVLCATALLAVVRADDDETRKKLEQELRNVPAPELPARAAAIVRSRPAGERAQAAIIAMGVVQKQRPVAAGPVAVELSKISPETRASLSASGSKRDKEVERDREDRGNGNSGSGKGNGNSGPGN